MSLGRNFSFFFQRNSQDCSLSKKVQEPLQTHNFEFYESQNGYFLEQKYSSAYAMQRTLMHQATLTTRSTIPEPVSTAIPSTVCPTTSHTAGSRVGRVACPSTVVLCKLPPRGGGSRRYTPTIPTRRLFISSAMFTCESLARTTPSLSWV